MDSSRSDPMRLMIFGAGYSGKAIGQYFIQQGIPVSGTTRSSAKAKALSDLGIETLVFDGQHLSDEIIQAMACATHVVQSIAPGSDGDPLLRLTEGQFKTWMPQVQWLAYLSTVGVYGDHQGAWVDEDTVCKPVSVRSVERVEAEQAWDRAALAAGVPLSTLRLSGIYGPGRNGLVNLAEGTARRLVKKDQVFNRIRVEDIATATWLLAGQNEHGIFNITDHEPAPPQDVVAEAARLMGVEPPPEQAFETAELSPMARSFYGENKRVMNAKIRALGFAFAYPDYRVSLHQLWSSGSWRG
ncbi:NAD-dependent epimerase/dehydratase family protein [Agrobacterium vitis]|uniref:NAD-dependent epimerase/dehydratase family protein n=2 Tax=Agrobacterium vitis TaxID=373 RepID=A0ABD6GCL0_AGRVI|nr:NAD-dependent epimerase/dehydratase family protein [Agrobacterium vitis]MUO93685.1 NAD-dependent epimerase/dehydratase family protein [Agrobacterium vitis]MUP04064.1 NAD-dependent epimerase/dehydratase family protein [Agrobacterium vitis]MUZ83173.1 NAD-dependent epimerase/dehydratase family protein [Agrobacterium vitis]MVA10987.1 NAD-dependent epimerase/dehydratase family protein [Agrobacterium vitis]